MPLDFFEIDHSPIPNISVDEFLSKCLLEPPGFGYRGQGDQRWDLVPSAFRGRKGATLDPVQRARRLQYFHNAQFEIDFKRLITLAGPDEQVVISEKQGYQKLLMLAFFQHFGIPTPLLDWTSSPLIALFMALFERPVGARDLSMFRIEPLLLPPDVTFQQYEKIPFKRIQTQVGGVMFFGTAGEAAINIYSHIYSEYICAGSPRFIKKLNIEIRPTDRDKIDNALRNNGFREDMLFPNSIQWVARQIRERMTK